jgi:CRISPR-associated endonuclease/helicase Cas3
MLLAEDEYHHLDAQPRIRPRATGLQPRERWVDLEQARIRAAMLPAPPAPTTRSTRRGAAPAFRLERDYAPAAWEYPQAALAGVLPQQQPFRHDEQPGTTLAWLPDEDEDEDDLLPHRVEDSPSSRRGEKLYVPATELLHKVALDIAPGISCWGEFDLSSLVREQAEAQDLPLDLAARRFTTVEVPRNDQGWRWHPWLGFTRQR